MCRKKPVFFWKTWRFSSFPAGVSIINYFGILKHSAVQIVIICIISTIITFYSYSIQCDADCQVDEQEETA